MCSRPTVHSPQPKTVKHKVKDTLFNTHNKVNLDFKLKIIYKFDKVYKISVEVYKSQQS